MRQEQMSSPRKEGLEWAERSISDKPLRDVRMCRENESLQRVGRSGWRFSKRAREGKSVEFGGQKDKRGMNKQMFLQTQEW